MKRNWPQIFSVVVIAFFAAGCVNLKAYSVNKPRVDQEVAGQEPPVKKTRKVYVLEVETKGQRLGEDAAVKAKPVESSKKTSVITQTQMMPPRTAVAPAAVPPEAGMAKTKPELSADGKYMVQPGDTLQTISKKFYGGFSKWPKIYDANKDRIQNVNQVKAGTVLIIPMDAPMDAPQDQDTPKD